MMDTEGKENKNPNIKLYKNKNIRKIFSAYWWVAFDLTVINNGELIFVYVTCIHVYMFYRSKDMSLLV